MKCLNNVCPKIIKKKVDVPYDDIDGTRRKCSHEEMMIASSEKIPEDLKKFFHE